MELLAIARFICIISPCLGYVAQVFLSADLSVELGDCLTKRHPPSKAQSASWL